VKTTREPEFQKQLTRRLKGEGGDSKRETRHTKFLVEEYAALLTKARYEVLAQINTPAVSDVESGVNAAFQVGRHPASAREASIFEIAILKGCV